MSRQRAISLYFLITVLLQIIYICLPSDVFANSQKERKSLIFFDRQATLVMPHDKLQPFFEFQQNKWEEIQEKYNPEDFIPQKSPMGTKNAQKWMALCNFLKKSQKIEILQGVNNFMNALPSKTDQELYNEEEYWATPHEFLKSEGGDCEDYVFAKYFALIYLGWPAEDLWSLMIFDKKHEDFHAVLGVELNGKRYILDNLAKPLHKLFDEAEYAKHIVPLSALNSQGLWIFEKGVEEYYEKYIKGKEQEKGKREEASTQP